METCSFSISSPAFQSPPAFHKFKHLLSLTKPLPKPQKRTTLLAKLNSPKGFGPPPRKTKNPKRDLKKQENKDEENEVEERREADVIPEIVTNRMIKRMGFSVGIPLFIGLMFFPLFYYLKVGLKVDVPSWVPVIVSFVFFGTALLGVSYGIVSSSWDPMREGSALGWIEAQKNWPVFWQSLRGSDSRRSIVRKWAALSWSCIGVLGPLFFKGHFAAYVSKNGTCKKMKRARALWMLSFCPKLS